MLDKYKNEINWGIRIIVAAMFIFGAWSKTPGAAIFQFEKQLADLGFDWCIVPYVSRLIIAFELFLGIAILQNNFLKRVIIPLTVLLLVAFCIHLGIIIQKTGGLDGNCGCFGKSLPMTPVEAFIKNIITIALLVWLYINYKERRRMKLWIPSLILVVSGVFTFLYISWTDYCCQCPGGELPTSVAPTQLVPAPKFDTSTAVTTTPTPEAPKTVIKPTTVTPDKTGKTGKPGTVTVTGTPQTTTPVAPPVQQGPAPRTSVFGRYHTFSKGVTANLDEGVKVVCMFNLECDHCMATCKEMGELGKTMSMPAYLICWSEPGNDPVVYQPLAFTFFKTAGTEYPYTVVGPETFFPLLGSAPSPPRVVVLHNGNIIADWDSNSFSKEKLKEVLTTAGVK